MIDAIGSKLTTPLAAVATGSQRSPFDAVIVGGGSAGITAARTLVETGKRVAILDAGPLVLLSHIQSTDLLSPQAADGSPFGSLIGCVGGRALFWNGAAPRFNAADFEGWPISIGDLEPHYAWAEQQFRVTTAYGGGRLGQEVIRRLQASGIDAQAGPYAVDCHATANGWLAGTAGNSLAPLCARRCLPPRPSSYRCPSGRSPEGSS